MFGKLSQSKDCGKRYKDIVNNIVPLGCVKLLFFNCTGAFGTATLYEKPNKKLVVVKEILLCELEAQEHANALNEVQILAAMNHPNIIRYL